MAVAIVAILANVNIAHAAGAEMALIGSDPDIARAHRADRRIDGQTAEAQIAAADHRDLEGIGLAAGNADIARPGHRDRDRAVDVAHLQIAGTGDIRIETAPDIADGTVAGTGNGDRNRSVRGARSVFLMCEALPVRYPPQPVTACPAFQPA